MTFPFRFYKVLTLTFFFLNLSLHSVQTEDIGYQLKVLPPPGHPRLFLRTNDLSEMKRRTTDPFYAKAWKRILEQSEVPWDGKLSPNAGNYDSRIHDIAEACALRYLLENDLSSGQKALEVLRNALPTVTFPNKDDITREKGATILTAAMVYDWCFPLLKSEDKTAFIKHMKRIAGTMEIGYPPINQGNVVGHSGEAQLFRDQLAGGVATYDEDPEMYRFAATRILSGMVPARNFFYPSGWHNQGSMYGPYRFQWEILSAWIFKRMANLDVFNQAQSQIPYGAVYSTRGDGWPFRDGDGPMMLKRSNRPLPPNIADILTASYYRDETLMSYSLERIRAFDKITDQLAFFLFADNSVKEQNWKALPLTRYFDEPAGMLMARTGWEEGDKSPVVAAQMKIAPYRFDNHQHLDHGHFQLWYKGLLTGDSGIYQGTLGGYACEHDINYHKRTIAHNCVTVYDPTEKFLWGGTKNGSITLANDGGQNWPGGLGNTNAVSLEALQDENNGYHVATVTAHGRGPDASAPLFSFMTGELSKAYSKKLIRYLRSFVFLNMKDTTHPAALIVYDRLTSADPKFLRKWLFHSPADISFSGNDFSVNSDLGGHLSATVILPELTALKMESLGGEEKAFWVEGKNYPQIPKGSGVKADSYENSGYRLELSDTQESNETRYLVLMQVRDKDTPDLPVTSFSGAGHVGLLFADTCVIFPKDYTELGELKLDLPTSIRHLLIIGATSGRWSASSTHGNEEIMASPSSTALILETQGGVIQLVHKN